MLASRTSTSQFIIAFLIVSTLLWLAGGAGTPATGSPEKSTPDLIQAAVDAGRLDTNTAEQYLTYALTNPSQLPAEFHSTQAWDGTLALLSLTADEGTAVADLPPHRQAIQDVLTSGSCGPMNTILPHVYTTPHFFIEYDTIGGGLTIEEYAAVLETTYTTLIYEYGWAAPPTNDALDGRYPVRVEALSIGLYGFMSDRGDYAGFVGDNPSTPWPEKYAYKSCIVLHQDYSGFLSPPEAVLRSTVAHEFTHAVQHGYGALRNHDLQADVAFVEGTATLMEDEIFDSANDNYHYLWPEFESCMGQYDGEPVSAWLVFRGLIERFGTAVAGGGEDVIQQVWETSGQATSLNNLQVLADALDSKGVNLTDAYHDYAIAARFTKACGAGYSAPYCFEEGANYVALRGQTVAQGEITAVDSSFSGQIQDNLALNWIDLPTGVGSYTVALNTAVGDNFHATVVCDTGTSFQMYKVQQSGSRNTAVVNSDVCQQATLVLTNEAITATNASSCTNHAYEVQVRAFALPENMTEQVFLPLIAR